MNMKCKYQGCNQEMYEKSQGTKYCRKHFDEFEKLFDEGNANGIVAFLVRSGGGGAKRSAKRLVKKLTKEYLKIRNGGTG